MRVNHAWRAVLRHYCTDAKAAGVANAANPAASAAAPPLKPADADTTAAPAADTAAAGTAAPAVVDKGPGAGLSKATSSLYELERANAGGFGSAAYAVAERKAKRDALFADPEFVENQLGRIPDKLDIIKGTEKDQNFERAMFIKNKKILPGFVMLTALGFGAVTIYYTYANEERKYAKDFGDRQESAAYIGTPKLGGPFKLRNCVTGEMVDSEVDLKGKWLFIYFGFTNCPDICPEEMNKLSFVTTKVRAILGEKFQPVFITVDPKRDDAEAVKEYLMDYHPSILGLVGTADEIDVVAKNYRVFYAVPDIESFTEEDYLVDHSIMTYLIDPNGRFCDYTTKEYNVGEAQSKVRECIKNWEREQIDRGLLMQRTEGLSTMRL